MSSKASSGRNGARKAFHYFGKSRVFVVVLKRYVIIVCAGRMWLNMAALQRASQHIFSKSQKRFTICFARSKKNGFVRVHVCCVNDFSGDERWLQLLVLYLASRQLLAAKLHVMKGGIKCLSKKRLCQDISMLYCQVLASFNRVECLWWEA